MEPYDEPSQAPYDGPSRVPRMLPGCGHTLCGACCKDMLRKLPARGGAKRLKCPVCRKPTKVARAKDLPKNFALLEVARGRTV